MVMKKFPHVIHPEQSGYYIYLHKNLKSDDRKYEIKLCKRTNVEICRKNHSYSLKQLSEDQDEIYRAFGYFLFELEMEKCS